MENLLEDLAELEHQQWAHWTKYMLDRLDELGDKVDDKGKLGAVFDYVEQELNWRRQITTPYSELTEKEKDSDRSWASKSLEITAKQLDAILEEMEKKANFFYNDTYDLANKTYERGFYDGIHNARAKIKEALEKRPQETLSAEDRP